MSSSLKAFFTPSVFLVMSTEKYASLTWLWTEGRELYPDLRKSFRWKYNSVYQVERYEHGNTLLFNLKKSVIQAIAGVLLHWQLVSIKNKFLGCLSALGHLSEEDPEWHSSAQKYKWMDTQPDGHRSRYFPFLSSSPIWDHWVYTML